MTYIAEFQDLEADLSAYNSILRTLSINAMAAAHLSERRFGRPHCQTLPDCLAEMKTLIGCMLSKATSTGAKAKPP